MYKICYNGQEVEFDREDDAVQYADELKEEGIAHRIYIKKECSKWVLVSTWTSSQRTKQ